MSTTRLILGDCLKEMARLQANSIHAVCTDPPYGLVEFSSEEIAKLRSGHGGVWRLPPPGCNREFQDAGEGENDRKSSIPETAAFSAYPRSIAPSLGRRHRS